LANGGAGRTNLPIPLTSFVGRERELAAVARLLVGDAPRPRLVTLTGTGGTGKTRLALHVAAGVIDRFADGVFLVLLAPIRDPGLVVPAVAQTLGVPDIGGRPPLEILKDHLRDKQLLLILDNFEQVLEAAPSVPSLLEACPRLTALVTSRAALRVSGEREVVVPPLAVPDPIHRPPAGVDPVAGYGQLESVQLFVARAQAVRADFRLTPESAPAVAAICRRLDGLPLAIELAAARTRVLDPPAILARLAHRLQLLTGGARDVPARQQTLRATIAWSYDLLAPAERALFRRLAVFVGGCTLAAAEAVGASAIDVLDGVDSLAAKSLVQRMDATAGDGAGAAGDGDGRVAMLETIREFGVERLAERGELPAYPRRHADHFLALAEAAEPGLRGPDARAWLDRLEAEHDNFRAALGWSLAGGEAGGEGDLALRLGGALAWFWYTRSYPNEGRRWLARALAAVPGRSAARMKALHGAGLLAHFQRDSAAAREPLAESLAIAREQDDRWTVAWALHLLGRVAYFDDDPARARALGRESLAVAEAVGDRWLIAWALHLLGLAAYIAADYATARTFYDRSLAIRRELGYQEGIGMLLHLTGMVAYREGDLAAARSLYVESLRGARDLGARVHENTMLALFAGLASAQQPDRAVRLAGASSRVSDSYHMPLIPIAAAALAEGLEVARQALGEAAYAAAWAEGRAMSLEQAVAYALAAEEPDSAGTRVPPAAAPPSRAERPVGLTARELDVLRLIVAGRSNQQIADALVLSVRTVERHIAGIYGKLGASGKPARAVATAYAHTHGLAGAMPAAQR
jgi:non-specific serine/threonine protein kinase